MDDKIKVTFDNEYKIRVLEPTKFQKGEELEKECSSFVTKISSFSEKVTDLVSVLEEHAERIDSQKLRVCYFVH
jgi:intraflagellar transport protein 20